ncbi:MULTISPECIES: hypothetical protein [unclassified Streptomyces]|uniref:hypothetical protein n=1 Tax=unclassified Streptomyces TaxID=2593676 RepID=UPI00278BE746|nr:MULTISPECIES: hypothetical protein [unclassified Streptomyces]
MAATLHRRLYLTAAVDPSSAEYAGTAFARFRYLFSTSPFWDIQFKVVTHEVKVGDAKYRPFSRALHAFCESSRISPEISGAMLDRFGAMLHLALRQDGPSEKRSLLLNSTIAATEGEVHVVLAYALAELSMPRLRDVYRIPDQGIQVVFGDGVLDYEFCQRHANSIRTYEATPINDWENLASANHEEESVCEDTA